MKLESNILFSAAAHLLFIAAALFLAGRNAVSHSPGRYIEVTLVSHEALAVSPTSGGRKAPAGTVLATVRGPATGPKKPAPPHIRQKAEVKAMPPEHKRTITRPVHISAPLSNKQAEVPKAAPPEAGKALTDGNKKFPPITEGRDFLSGSEEFTIDIPHYSAAKPFTGIIGTGGAFHSPAAFGASPSDGDGKGGGIHGADGAGEKGRNQAIGEIRALIERARRYPLLARNRGIEGTATAEFSINTRGLPENVKIKTSSGSAVLDSAAEDTIIRAAPFPVVEGNIEIPITFRLRQEK